MICILYTLPILYMDMLCTQCTHITPLDLVTTAVADAKHNVRNRIKINIYSIFTSHLICICILAVILTHCTVFYIYLSYLRLKDYVYTAMCSNQPRCQSGEQGRGIVAGGCGHVCRAAEIQSAHSSLNATGLIVYISGHSPTIVLLIVLCLTNINQ